MSLNKSVFYASFSWLQQHAVVDEQDLNTFEKLKGIRNQLAHQLFAVVTGQIESEHESQLEVLIELLRKIEFWWVVNFEIPINSDFNDQEIDEQGIVPGSILALQMLLEVASGNATLLEHVRKAREKKDASE